MIEITLVRHGQSEANVTGHWQGQGDSPLSERGYQQAAALAKRLAAEKFDFVVSSDLSRAADTARAAADTWGVDVQFQPEWREIDVGEWEGLTRPEVATRFADQIAKLQRGDDVRVGGGESWGELAARGTTALDALRTRMHASQRAIVFAHGGIISSVLVQLLGIPLRRPRPLGNINNTGVTTLRFDGDSFSLERFNDTTHWAAVGDWGEARREQGAALIALSGSSFDEFGYEHMYRHGEQPLSHPTLQEAVGYLAQAHPGHRVGVQTRPDAVTSFARRLLRCDSLATIPPQSHTHIVATRKGLTLADFSVGLQGSPVT